MGVAKRAVLAAVSFFVLTACGESGRDRAPRAGEPPTAPAPATTGADSAPANDTPKLVEVGEFDEPIYLTAPSGDARLFVVEKTGRIKVVDAGRRHTFIDLSDQVSSGFEQGLFSLAFAPDYSQSGLTYVSFTDKSGDSRIVEYRVDPDNPNRLDPATRRQVLFLEQPFSNHNGGLILFDPGGMLIAGFGDGGSSGDPQNRAQNLNVLLGKLLRIDPLGREDGKPYGIPDDNPFVRKPGARPEVWASGLRNPWRFSFDPESGALVLGDVGQNKFEEVNFVPAADQAGANFGWPRYEGLSSFKRQDIDESRLVRPVVTYPLSSGACSVTSGGVYRGSVQSLKGAILFADFCRGQVKQFRMSGARATAVSDLDGFKVDSLSSFGQDSNGEMYVLSLDGKVLRIEKA